MMMMMMMMMILVNIHLVDFRMKTRWSTSQFSEETEWFLQLSMPSGTSLLSTFPIPFFFSYFGSPSFHFASFFFVFFFAYILVHVIEHHLFLDISFQPCLIRGPTSIAGQQQYKYMQ